jgi:30S ribosomal protein S31
MGKGDRRSKRGKIFRGTFGKRRPKPEKERKKAVAHAAAAAAATPTS